MLGKMKAWLERQQGCQNSGNPPVASEVPEIRYDDQRSARLADLDRALRETRSTLTQYERKWESATGRDDPDAHAWRSVVGPRILELRQQEQQQEAERAAVAQAITDTQAAVVQYAQLIAETLAWFGPTLARVEAALRNDDLRRAFQASRALDAAAAELLQATGDRGFRRPRCHPYGQLKDALEDGLRRMTGVRLMRSARSAETKTAS